MMKKKGSFNLTVRQIIVIILLIILLLLLLAFIRKNWRMSMETLEEQMVAGAPKPNVDIIAPNHMDMLEVGDVVAFQSQAYSNTPNVKIIGYYWDFNTDGFIDSRVEHPHYIYYEPGDYEVTLKVLNDLGGIGSDRITIRVFTKNKKNTSKYSTNAAFFIQSQSSNDPLIEIQNWREIIKVIPLTRWYDITGDNKYDYVAISKMVGQPIEAEDVEQKLNALEKTSAVAFDIFGLTLASPYTINSQATSDLQNYFSYWDKYDCVVVLDRNNFNGSLIAGLFSSYYNSPLMFLEDRGPGASYADYDPFLVGSTGKKFYVIDNIPDAAFNYYIGSGRVADWIRYNSSDLRDPSRKINRIVELESKLGVRD